MTIYNDIAGIKDVYDKNKLLPFFESDEKLKVDLKFIVSKSNYPSRQSASYRLAIAIYFQDKNIKTGEDYFLTPTSFQLDFMHFMREWDLLYLRQVDNELWIDLIEEGINLLKDYLDSDSLSSYREDQRFLNFMQKFNERIKYIQDNWDHCGDEFSYLGEIPKSMDILYEAGRAKTTKVLKPIYKDDLTFKNLLLDIRDSNLSVRNQLFKIGACLSEIHFGILIKDYQFRPTEFQKSVYNYHDKWSFFIERGFPLEEWNDILILGMDLLKALLIEEKMETFEEDIRYKEFMKVYSKRWVDLSNKIEHAHRYGMGF